MSHYSHTLPAAAAAKFYLEQGLCVIGEQFGEAERHKHPEVLAAFMQACALAQIAEVHLEQLDSLSRVLDRGFGILASSLDCGFQNLDR
ncbi:hypothetical protein [Rhodoferax sp.]|uniref:hypothetical protein n=1 Tax=Rhodoferax sp. TaxID=50421 RepID=UPI00374DE678